MPRRPDTDRSLFSRTDARKKSRTARGLNRFGRRLHHETLEKRELLAADLLAIRPDAGALISEGTNLSTPPREFSLLFNGDANLDENSITNDTVRLVRAGDDATLGTADDVQVSLGYVGFVEPGNTDSDNLHKIVLRPASTAAANATDPSFAFPDDFYRIEVIGSGSDPLQDLNGVAFNGGQDSLTPFRLDRGIQVTAVIPQPIERAPGGSLTVHEDRIDVYFDDQEIAPAVAENPAFYRLVDTAGPADVATTPDSVSYFPAENRVSLQFSAAIPAATYRLDIGSSLAPTGSSGVLPQTFSGEIGTSFEDLLAPSAAGNFGSLSSGTSVKVASEISPLGSVALPARPGGLDEPGHREVQIEAHYGSTGLGPVAPQATQTRYYSFPDEFPANAVGIVYKNFISPSEKEIVRGILEIYAQQIGMEFVESNTRAGTLVIGKGDLQAADPEATSGPGGVAGLGGGNLVVMDKEDYAESNRYFGDGFTGVAFHEIGHALGLGHAYEIPATMGGPLPNDQTGSNVSPGDNDLIHLQRIIPPNSNDIDLYRFNLVEPGEVQIETSAERLATPSLLNTVLRLFRKNDDGTSELVAQNDRYYGSDSLIEVELEAGEYFFGVSSAGNESYDPAIPDSGFGGTTDGNYEVQISFTARPTAAQQLTDIDGTAIDGDGDGTPGGVHSFWFESDPNAIYVDKLAAAGGTGTIADPYNSIAPALAAAQAITAAGTTRALVRVAGNVDESSPTGLRDATPYLIGSTRSGEALADGNSLTVPQGTTVRIEAGALLKLRAANIDVGTSSIGANRAGGAVQVLGTPTLPVYLRSYHDDQAGGDSDGNGPSPTGGDYGGIVLRDDSDLESDGVFLSTINHADIQHGGGKGTPTGTRVFSPIDINDARPTISFNTITDAAKAAISASPNSFDDSLGRIGPDVLGNYLRGNTDNGLFVGIPTNLGSSVQKMTVSGRFDDTDITHILTESLIIVGNPGGPILEDGVLTARPSGRLIIDPGTVVKLRESRIESERGAATLIAEGTANSPIIFTSVADSRYGGSGVFQTNSGSATPQPGDWGGLFFGEASRGSLDHTVIAFGGGVVPTAATAGGASDRFNAVEIHQADVRIANSLITDNADGNASGNRFGRGNNQAAAIYVRGSQPILVDNQIVGNAGPAININANSLRYDTQVDSGRSIGAVSRYSQFDDNRGPLIRLNELDDNGTNGLKVRGETLATQSVWDDSDIVHVLDGQIVVGNHHTYSGLRLQSNVSESLVVKVDGADSGFTATGTPLDIVDRIGGTIQVIGLPGYPVVITHLSDDSVGAGFTPDGHLMTDTNNGGGAVGNQAWQGFQFDEWSNDRNVAIIREAESPLTGGESINSNPITKAQPLGVLAPDLKSGDENRRLGFQVHGYISPDDATDEDVYSFQATAGTQVWIDIDRTNTTLDTAFDIVLDDGTPSGTLVFSSDDPIPFGQPGALTQEPWLGGDYYTLTNNDPGASVILVDTGTYYVRVRAVEVDHDGDASTPAVPVSKGEYQLQVRLQQIDEFPGSTVRYADVRYASTAFDVQGLPRHSPLVGDAAEADDAGGNVTGASSQELVNLLETDAAAISLAGALGNAADVDVYQFNVEHEATQSIPGVTTAVGTVSVVFDMDYADEKRGDTTIAVFDEDSRLVFIGRESNVVDDQPAVGGDGQSLADLSRGSLGTDDPYIGPVHLIAGEQYYVAVMSNQVTPSVVASQFALSGPNGTGDAGTLTRLEPINSVDRIVEDHIGFTGYLSSQDEDGGGLANNIQPLTGPLLDISTSASLDTHVASFRLQDVGLFVATDRSNHDDHDNLYTVDPFSGGPIIKDLTFDDDNLTDGENDIQDIVIRGDGVMYGYRRNVDGANMVGQLVTLDPFDGTVIATQDDNIPGVEGFSNVRDVFDPPNPNARSRAQRADEVTHSDEVDAVTFRRNGDTGGDAPVPRYETYYSVRESDNASRLYRGDANGDASPAAPTNTTNRYGFIGDIQPAGVTFAEQFVTVNNGNPDDYQFTNILLRSNIPGEAGNFSVSISYKQGGDPVDVSLFGDTINIRLRRAGDPLVVNATANDIVNAINDDDDVKERVIALVYSGNDNNNGDGNGGLTAVGQSVTPRVIGVGAADEVLQGRVTGLAMGNYDGSGDLYGVTSGGEFISVSRVDGEATVLQMVPGVSFAGLSQGPQNVEGGRYKNTLFATTDDGQLFAFNTDGTFANVFDSGDSAQLVQVTPGGVAGGDFTLTVNDGVSRQTTLPIAAEAPTNMSVNAEQTLLADATVGTFTLSVEKSYKAITSLQSDIDDATATIQVQAINLVDGVAPLPATPFVIEVESEQMLVTSRAGNTLTVVRGHNGTTAVAHADTETVSEVVTSTVAAPINAAATTIQVNDATPFPTAGPFQIRIGGEDIQVNAVAGNTLSVVRGINGTTAAAANAGATIQQIQTTGSLTYDASSFAIRNALRNLSFIGFNGVNVSGDLAGGATVEFQNGLGHLDVSPLTADNSGLGHNEHQVISLGAGGGVDAGTYTLSFGGDTTDPIAYDADAAAIRDALTLLPSIGAGNVNVTTYSAFPGSTDVQFEVEFTGALGLTDQPAITADSVGLINNERQQLSITGAPTGGTFTLSLGSSTSAALNFDVDAAAVKAAIVSLLSQESITAVADDVTVTGGPMPGTMLVEFSGTLEDVDLDEIVVDVSSLTGGTPAAASNTLENGDSISVGVSSLRSGGAGGNSLLVIDEVQGVRSVEDSLVALSTIGPNDVRVRGDLATGVTVHFTGILSGVNVDPMDVDNSLMLPGATATTTVTSSIDDGLGDEASTSITGMDGAPIGLAFSPLDFNLWHPTMQRANDAGHGINPAPDNSRNSLGDDFNFDDGITGTRQTSQGSGGASFYFGLEQWTRNPNTNFQGYMSPADRTENAQYGLSLEQHRDLSSNAAIRNTYDLAGGAKGSLTTNEFSLDTADYYDRPTLYFNYLLETEAASGINVSNVDAEQYFRDSARVYASRDDGVTWELVATNNSVLSGADASDGDAEAELPTFLSHVADAGANSADPQPESKQIVQELFDAEAGNPVWHQARIDLSPFAGEASVKLRFDFSTSGSSIEGNLSADRFGDVNDDEHSVGGSNNNFEGFYIDDLMVGFAERGEMVTNAPPTTNNAFTDLSQNNRTDVNRDDDSLTNQLSGEYQLEMRRAGEYAFGSEGSVVVFQTFDTNARHILELLDGTGVDADRNKQREQGLLILENNIISDSRVVGVHVAPPAAQGEGSGVTYPGPTQNFSDKDDQGLVPGIVIQNNIIVGSSGVDYSGQPNGTPQRPAPVGRIINNTFIGDGQYGVQIRDNASPTLLNNVFSTLSNGIIDNGVGAIIDNNYFNNAGAALGSDAREGTDPLFIDPDGRNYYPLSTAGTINNSQDLLNDRGSYAAFKDILGIPQSPYFAPSLDAFGQLRVSGGIGGDGAGPNTDIDIGAADYSDFVQPYASLLNPVDQDDAGLDSDPAETFIQLDNPDVQAFSVLLSDGENANSPFAGTGIDPDTVNASTVLIRQDNRLLEVGRDFNLAFNPSTGELRLTPLSDLWNPNSVYEIILLNGDQKVVTLDVENGSVLTDGDQVAVTNGGQSATLEFDSGYVVQLGAADSILDGQTFEYSTATGTQGYTARFQINKMATSSAGNFTGEVGLGQTPAGDDLTIEVTTPGQFAVGDFIRISDEIMAVVGVDATAGELTVQRAVLGTPRMVHQAGARPANLVEQVDAGQRAVIDSAIGNVATDDSFLVFQASDLGLDPAELALTGMMTFVRVNEEVMRVTGYDEGTGTLTVQRGALGSTIASHSQFSIVEVVASTRSATLATDQTVHLDDVLLDGTTAGPLTVTGDRLLASDRIVEVTPDADFVPKVGDLLQIGSEIVKITDVQPAAIAGDLSLSIDRGLFDTAVVEHAATMTETIAGVETTYPTPIRLIDSAFQTISLFESDPLDDVELPAVNGAAEGQMQSGIASKIARAMREFQASEPSTAGDLDLRLPHAQGIEGGRVYLGGHVGDSIAFSSGSAAGLSASLVAGAEPGVSDGAIAVPFIPSASFPQSAVNAAVLSAINNADNLGLTGVSEGGGGFYLVSDSGGDIAEISVASTGGGFTTSVSDVHGIADKAGNLLRPNRSTQTRFTVGVGPTAYDFGDGVDTADPNNLARHTVLGLGTDLDGDPRLGPVHDSSGRIVDSEDSVGASFDLANVLRDDAVTPPATAIGVGIDALATTVQVTAGTAASFADRVGGYLLLGDEIVRLDAIGSADSLKIARGQLDSRATSHDASTPLTAADDENGLDLSAVEATFNIARTTTDGGGPVMINVLATDYGVVDGWIDFNHNGRLDVGDNPTNYDERVFDTVAVWPGENLLPVSFPTTLPGGATITGDMVMRLRVSKLGGLSADGLAIGGEVEDHEITIVAGVPPLLKDLNDDTIDDDQTESFTTTEHVLGMGATPATGMVFQASVDADDQAISVLEIVDLQSGRAYPVEGGAAVIDELHDSLGRLAGKLTVQSDSTVTFVPRSNYDTGPVPGPDGIPGTADDVSPVLEFGYRVVDASGVAGVETGTISLSVTPVNQAPTLDSIATTSDAGEDLDALVEDQDLDGDNVIDKQNVTLTGISAGAGNVQPVRVTATTVNLADDGSGAFVDGASQSPLLITDLEVVGLDGAAYDGGSSQARLAFGTTPDQYGTASITVTVTDPGLDGDFDTAADNLTVSETLTVTVAPVNDKPATVERLWTQSEAAEGAGETPVSFAFTAADLAGTSGAANPFDDKTRVDAGGSGAAPFNEENQLSTLTVSKLILPDNAVITYLQTDAAGDTLITQADRTLEFANLFDSTGAVSYGEVTVTFAGSDGQTGMLVIQHSGGRFDSAVYTPEVDANDNYDGLPQELQYVISDSGVSIAPKVNSGEPDTQLGATDPIESNPETIRFAITPKADSPFLGDFLSDINIDETEADTDPSNDSYTLQLADLFVDEDLAFLLGAGADETGTVPASWISITANAGNPAGLLALPTVNQTADTDPISLTLTPVPDAYGVAEFDVTITNPDNGLASATKTLTVTVNPTNDAPMTSDRVVTGQEDIAYSFDISDLIHPASDPTVASEFVGDGVTPPMYDESEQDLLVYGFQYLDTEYLSADYDNGPGVDAQQVVELPNGDVTLTFRSGVFVSGTFTPDPDYFVDDAAASALAGDVLQYTVIDAGQYFLYGPGTGADSGSTVLVGTAPVINPLPAEAPQIASASITFVTEAVNDAPTIPAYTPTVNFYEDQPTSFSGILQANIFADPTTDRILPGPGNERVTQTMVEPVTLSYVSGTAGMLAGDPTLSLSGTLSIEPMADAFGTAVYEITLTDSEGATTTPKPLLTISIDAVNDQPIAYNRSIIMDEAVEPATASQMITAEDLILGNQLNLGQTVEQPAIPAHADINPLFAENDSLEIAEIIVPDASGNPRPFRGASNEPSQVETATGGILTLTFAPSQSTNVPAGTMRFVSAEYVPAVDYNQTTPYFKVTDDFQFIVRDSGPNTTDQDATLQHRSLSEPASARISVVAKNDPPVFPTLEIVDSTVTFSEIEVGDTTPQQRDVYAGSGTRVQAGPSTAIDELALQTDVGVRFVPVSVPPGLMASLPTMTNDGVIEVHPNADAYGDAVYDVIASDGILDASAQRITIAITGTNDAPTAPAYAFTTLEDQPVTIHDVANSVDLSDGARASSLPVDSPFNESGQDLQVVGIGMVDPNDPDTNLPTPDVTATDASISYVFDANLGTETATEQVKTPNGTLDVTFEQRVNGELSSGFISKIVYTPDPGYNDTLPDDTFTYFVSDYGNMPVPGSDPARDLVIPTDVASELSLPARVSVRVGPVNTPPTVPEFEDNGVFVFDEDATAPDTIRNQVFLDDSLVIDAGGGADEADQTVQITLTADDTTLANQVFSAPTTLTADGTLQVFPNPDAFGTVTYTLSVVDLSPEGDVLTNPPVTREFTIVVNSVNDQPTAAAKAFTLAEHREELDAGGSPVPTSDGDGFLDISAETLLLNNAAGGAAQPSSFVDSIEPPFNEIDQLGDLRVTGLGLAGATAPAKSADDPTLVYGDVAGEMIATDSLEIANGTLTITYQQSDADVSDRFVKSIRYTPDADYNSASPYDPTDLFTYFVDDGGSLEHLSAAAIVTMTVTATNDLPSIPALRSDTVNAAEFVVGDEGGAYSTNVFTDSGAVILPGPAPSDSSPGARDENANSTVHIDLERISGAGGLFDTEPTLTENGTLSLDANPDAFGSAVYDIVVSERDLSGNTSPALDQVSRQRITITLSSGNDVPTAPDRTLEMLEFSELENGTGNPVTGDPTTIVETEQRLLDLNGDFEGPASAGGSADFPEIQTLHVTGIGLAGDTTPAVTGESLVGDYATNPGTGNMEASQSFTLANGVLTVTFVEVTSGNATERYLDRLSYVPDTDYNSATPGTTPDQFTYFVTDSGTPAETSAPGLVTLQVNPNNDVPTFTVNSDAFGPNDTLYAPIRDDGGTVTFSGLVSDLSPGPPTAADEQANQTVVFRYQPADSEGTNGTDLSTLFRREPDLINGTLYLYPAVNATGTATLVFRADDGPDSRVDPNTKYQELTLNIDIGSRPVPEAPPIRTGTYNNPDSSGVAIVDLNDVFLSTDGLDLSETVILTNGTGGVASINPTTGELEYRPNPGHLGEDVVIIEVQDNSGVKSGPVEVQFNTTRNRLTNPVIAEDVNRSGLVTSLDALVVINLLNEQENGDGVPVDSISGDDYYYDVSDNGVVTSLDALRVINYLNEQGPSSSPEPIAPQSTAPQSVISLPEVDSSIVEESSVSTIDADAAKVNGTGQSDASSTAVLDLIAVDQAQDKEKADQSDSHESSLDAAISDLF
ncbi:dockerin type I domain-containing protein [Allorhodopirellula solitaria]|uniref:Peptidase metallopeptidase domain-containing protein n=1 Tax=Allorhodopirellula solitaria TaxID=2527987 RepID=A0A5C5XVE0_9BACT|nr:dockerin type I domain-containing protein [Allorhodopirellula solitaria]TWT66373.1 hypothetical protein CA85_24670 [Allorhodopirellula solitaria]